VPVCIGDRKPLDADVTQLAIRAPQPHVEPSAERLRQRPLVALLESRPLLGHHSLEEELEAGRDVRRQPGDVAELGRPVELTTARVEAPVAELREALRLLEEPERAAQRVLDLQALGAVEHPAHHAARRALGVEQHRARVCGLAYRAVGAHDTAVDERQDSVADGLLADDLHPVPVFGVDGGKEGIDGRRDAPRFMAEDPKHLRRPGHATAADIPRPGAEVRDALGLVQQLLTLGQGDALRVLVASRRSLQLGDTRAQRHDLAPQ
jgi:hypothetical protein